MNRKISFRVLALVSLQSVAGRKKYYGVSKFLNEGWPWDMELLRSDQDFTPERIKSELRKGFDGLLILVPKARELLEVLCTTSLPMAFTDTPSGEILKRLPYSFFVYDDARDIVRKAIEHLLSCRSIKSIGFVPTRNPTPWSSERMAAFKSLTSRCVGITTATFPIFEDEPEQLVRWLHSLPRPAGIVSTFDDRAKDILMAARESGLRTPKDISVIGIGNDELICEATNPPLASVAIDFAGEGYRAARELQAMMLKKIRPAKRYVLVGSQGVILRKSTPAPSDNATLVRSALQFINEHALEGIGVKDVVSHMRISRRLADLRFGEKAGCTILTAILTRRVEEAKRLLSGTNAQIKEVAMRCGYQDANYFKNVFRRLTGLSPQAWRKQANSRV